MVMAKTQWINSAAKLNPSVSQEDLGKIYDDHVNNPTVVNQGAPITPMDAKFNPDGMPLASHGQKTSYYDSNVSPNTAINHITATNQSVGENKKNAWMTHAAALNPNTNPQALSKIYDDYISSPDRQNVDQQEQLAAIQKWNDHLYRDNKPTPETDPDEGKAGFDASDKMSMLGSAFFGYGKGIDEGLYGLWDLALKLPEHYGLVHKGYVASLKEKQNRFFSQSKLMQEAHTSHPVVNSLSNFVGGIIPTFVSTLAGGEALSTIGIGAKVATMADSIKAVPTIAKGIRIGSAAMEKMGASAVVNGAQKFMTKVLPLMRHGAEGALYGAASYDPKANTEMKNATAGAIAALALGAGGGIVKGMSSKLAPEIAKLQERYKITLPVMPRFNAFLSSMPLLGNGVKVAETQKEYIDNLGKQMANKISPIQERKASSRSQYGRFLHNELAHAVEKNKKTASEMYQKVSDESMKLEKTKKLVDLTNVKQIAQDLQQEEQEKIPSLQNKLMISRLNDFKNTPNLSYKDVQANRSAIGEEQGATVGREAGAYKMIYKGLSDAMDDYAEEMGSNIKSLHDAANQFYKEKVVPFLYGKWKKFLAPDYDTDDFLKDFLKPEHPGRIQDILGKLPEKEATLTAARAAMVHSALDDAELPTGGFNPEKFVKNLTKLGETNDVVFTPEQRGIIEGYGRLLQLTRKLAPKWLKDMPAAETSHMLRYGHIHGGAAGGMIYLMSKYPHIAIPAIAGATGFIRLFTSTAGRKLLLNISKLSTKLSDSELSEHVSKAARIAVSSGAPTLTAGL